MNVNIYYGGRGMVDDPTLYVLNTMQEVLEELHVRVARYNLHEMKNEIMALPNTLKDADGIILATTVEWLGMNGWLQVFLDACWFYGDKAKISNIYMVPVVMSTTYGEREAQLNLVNAWEMLGGKSTKGLCGYVEDAVVFEMNKDYKRIIEKQAEELYRSISQKIKVLPSSTYAIKQNILKESMDFTPQESEQLSKYASNEGYVKKQKADIEELAGFYKNMLESNKIDIEQPYLDDFKRVYNRRAGLRADYQIEIMDKKKDIQLKMKTGNLECSYGKLENPEMTIRLNCDILEDILAGRSSFQTSFMKGDMTAKGDFAMLRQLDLTFPFKQGR